MHTKTTPQPAASLRFRTAQFRRYAATRGLATDTEIAVAAGLDRSTVNRLLRGDVSPGERTIAAFLTAFPDRRFEDFFEVAGGAATRAA
jgi:transcriptional regulator with XRE-family HTH domain